MLKVDAVLHGFVPNTLRCFQSLRPEDAVKLVEFLKVTAHDFGAIWLEDEIKH